MAAMFKKLLTVCAAAAVTFASLAAAVELRQDHPDTYVVQKGDTLWDIAGRFLQHPWLWPEIWQANPQIENPHLIYPGDEISLAYLSGQQRITSNQNKLSPRVRRSTEEAIPTVPLSDVEAFLKKPHVLDEDEYKNAPYVLDVEDRELRGVSGMVVYVRGAEFEPGQEYAIVRPTVRYAVHPHPATGEPRLKKDPWNLKDDLDPTTSGIEWAYYASSDNGFEVLGYEVIEIARGRVTVPGDPGTVLIGQGGYEVKAGDLLLPADDQPFDLTFMPRAPDSVPDNMRILAVTDRMRFAGTRDVVALSAGAREGIENGQVFALYAEGDTVRDDVAHKQRLVASLPRNKVKLPDQFLGHVMIFRTFDKVSYGLIMDGIKPAKVGDLAKMPVEL